MDEKPHIWKENTPVNQSEEPTLQWYRTNPPRRVPHCHTIILLHDQASSGAELRKELFGAEMSLAGDRPKTLDKALDCCRWVFPNAPFRGGNFFSDELQWFSTPYMEDPYDSPYQQPQMEASIRGLLRLVQREEFFVGRQNIFIGGHGQGFALAAGALLVDGRGDFGGLIGLNGWFPYAEQLFQESGPRDVSEWVEMARALLSPSYASSRRQGLGFDSGNVRVEPGPTVVEAERDCGIVRRNTTGDTITPIFLAHPAYDDVVHPAETALASEVFQAMGWDEINWEDYPLDHHRGTNEDLHGINIPRGVTDLWQWLSTRLRNCGTHPRGGHFYNFVLNQAAVGTLSEDLWVEHFRWRFNVPQQ